jgi:hypothetical protein
MACDSDTKRVEFEEQVREISDDCFGGVEAHARQACDNAIRRFNNHMQKEQAKLDLDRGTERLSGTRDRSGRTLRCVDLIGTCRTHW